MRRFVLHSIILGLLFLQARTEDAGITRLKETRAKYEAAEKKLNDDATAAAGKTLAGYRDALAALEKTSLARNDFPLSLAVRDEKKRLETALSPAAPAELSAQPQVRALQQQFSALKKGAEDKLLRDRFHLAKGYLAYLDTQAAALEKQGQIEAALLARRQNAEVQPAFEFMLEQMASLSAAPSAPPTSPAPPVKPTVPPTLVIPAPGPVRPIGVLPGAAPSKPVIAYSFDGEGKEFAASQGTAPAMELSLEKVSQRKGVLGMCARFAPGVTSTVAKGPSLDGKSYTFLLWFNLRQKGSHGFFGINKEHPMAKCVGEGRKINVGWHGQPGDEQSLTVWVMDKKLEVPCELDWGVWKHLAVRYDAGKKDMVVFVDGKRAGDKDMPVLEGSNGLRLWVGQLEHSSGYWWGLNGGLDEFQLHESALTDAQIAQAYQAGAAALLVLPRTERDLETWLEGTEWEFYNAGDFTSLVPGGLHLKDERKLSVPWKGAEDHQWKMTGPRSFDIRNGSGTPYISVQLAPDLRSWTGTSGGGARSGKRVF